MREFIIMLSKSGVDFEKKTNRGGNGDIKDIKVTVATDNNGAATTFIFDETGDNLMRVTHN